MNETAIETLQDFKKTVQAQSTYRDIINIQLKDVDLDENQFIHNDVIIEQKAMSKILSSLRVKDDFLEYRKLMEPSTWDTIKDNLKRINQNTQFYGKRVYDALNDKYTITKLFQKHELNENFSNVKLDTYIDFIINSLKRSTDEYEVKKAMFNAFDEFINISLLVPDRPIDIFNNDTDIWKGGVTFNWDMLQFHNAPFFERLICENGMVGERYAWKNNIQNKNFNVETIEKQIERLVNKKNGLEDELIIEKCNHLKNTNLSVLEYEDFSKFFKKINTDQHYEDIIETAFDNSDIFKAYGVDINDKSERWKSTANSGRNGYDFLNDMTYLGTHKLADDHDKKSLSLMVSNLFFKKSYDLEDVAETIEFSIPKIYDDVRKN